MAERIFKVCMQVPLGEREGWLRIQERSGVLSGYLDLLGHSEPLSGEIEPDGQCTISGRIRSLVRAMDYTATGTIWEGRVLLNVRTQRAAFQMTGEEVRDETVL